jgi:plastocyanin
MSNKNPILSSVRILPKDPDFLDRKVGSSGEIFFDPSNKTLRLFDGITHGGIPLLRADLENIEGNISSVIVSNTAPQNVDEGTIWFNSNNGKLYIYYDDGNSFQWVQPTVTAQGGGGGGGASNLNELTDVTITNAQSGQVLKYNGTAWVNGSDNVGGGGSFTIDGLDDVVISNPGANQALLYNGTNWINSALTSVSVTSITAGTGITVSANTGNITISSSASPTTFNGLTDATSASITIDKIAYQAMTRFNVTNVTAIAYQFNNHYTGNNPTIYVISGTTVAFNLNVSGHPFLIQDTVGNNYNTGLIHVSTSGVVSTGASAQGRQSGTLYWQIPQNIGGNNYRYQCSIHPAMVGLITIKDIQFV